MNDIDLPLLLTSLAIVGAGLNGGIYFTFSTFTMNALRRLPPARAASAMQAVNVEAVRPAFMSLFFGTAVLGILLYGLALVDFAGARSVLSIIGASLYLSSIVVTAAYNVPLNDRLAAVDPSTPVGGRTWDEYQRRWTRGNHLRVAVCVASMVVLLASLLV
ncbi:MAG: anthrone oxygenase family protein [Candidatus Limnocylindrales bacterium]